MRWSERFIHRLWTDERGISSIEYALLLAMIAGGVVFAAALLSGAVSNEMTGVAELFGEADGGCGNAGGGDGTGGDNQTGQGGDNTC